MAQVQAEAVRAALARGMALLACLTLATGCARGVTPEDTDAAALALGVGDAGLADAAGARGSERDARDNPLDAGRAGPQADADRGPASEADAGEPPSPKPACVAGTYVGTFSGNISALYVVNLPIAGEISIDVGTSSSTAMLVIENGSITGQDQDGNPITADVEGTLNCTTRQLEGGALKNGKYERTTLNQTVEFEGSVAATYYPGDVPRVTGTWKTTGGVEKAAGDFSASLSP
jgi:hypothetical protein